MNFILKFASKLFHPLLIPLFAVSLYFIVTPRFFPWPYIQSKIIAVGILSFLIPVLIFFLLKSMSLVNTISLPKVKERKIPLIIYICLLFILVKAIIEPQNVIELHYYFIGVLYACIAAFILVLLKFKASLHALNVSALTVFIMGLSIHYTTNLLILIGFFLFVNGFVASSRLHLKAHSPIELIVGGLIGALCQLLMFNFWL